MRLTPEVIRSAPVSLNPLKERELGLRSLSIAVIENLGVTEDVYDSIDLTDNQIFKLDNFPVLQRLKTLMLGKNHISSISPNLGKTLPNLHSLVLSDNQLSTVSSLLPLSTLTSLKVLLLGGNPIVDRLQNYRVLIVALVPTLTCLDCSSIRDDERAQARRLRIKLDAGTPLEKLAVMRPQKYRNTNELDGLSGFPSSSQSQSTTASTTATATAATTPQAFTTVPTLLPTLTEETKEKLIAMIDAAETLEEIEKIEEILSTGVIPSDFVITG